MKKYFQFEKNSTDLRTEVLAGITTFMATAYIIFVNPSILSQAGLPFNAVLTATVLVSFFTSVAMGIYAKNPIVLAPGMGINAFFTFSVVLGGGIDPRIALGAVFWSGIIFLLMSAFQLREILIKAIPVNLRLAIACGIGLFIALIGFVNAGVVVDHPATLVSAGGFTSNVWIFFFGLIFSTFLMHKKIPGGLLLGIVLTATLWFVYTIIQNPQIELLKGIVAYPDFSLVGALDIKGSISLGMLHVVFSLVFTDLFDSISTFMAVAEAGDLKDKDGNPKNIKKSLLVDAFGSTLSGILGTSNTTSFIESAAGITQGGRTGLTAVVAGCLFLPFLFLSPILSLVPQVATAPALVIVGLFMMSSITKINFKDISEGLPAFMAMIMIPFTYSISEGIIWGFFTYTALKILCGKAKDLGLGIVLINVFCLLSVIFG